MDIAVRVWKELGKDHVSLVAAGVAMFAMLALFPGLAAVVYFFSIFANGADLVAMLTPIAAILPADVMSIISDYLSASTSEETDVLSVAAIVGMCLALWSARKGANALIRACSVVYEEPRRGFLRGLVMSILFTLGGIGVALIILVISVAVPIVATISDLPTAVVTLIGILKWIALWLIAVLTLSAIYRFAPNRTNPRWRWVSVGAATAATICMVNSLAFSWYVTTWANYGDSYGSLAGFIVMLLWFYITSFTIILGAEINAEIEHQTIIDTTIGPEKPIGERGAYVADNVGPAQTKLSNDDQNSAL